ncbi:class I adenylate-forming enzyme family protein [Sphingobium boeckii]|uniref:Acyl-CoA synthetase (AMP-forming)/AMP-acid ligase II n=1 Tax=Sphingobium boeckii TaxID=1082345 RepID=A0A7W9AJF4_9SPHN|nr:AMP-binding protein [Sphingobium boeckii]MBB5686760.1 acyl-CoA synthetase (AMP-forming)/AMP-acid ligase II [Sphingobium boeckii]
MKSRPPSIIAGRPLSEEEGLGALTLGGWLREVTDRFGPREALVLHEAGGVTRWSYDELWERANAVARSLIACGVGKGTRVGVLMTNRPEFLSAVFGTALAGGVATTLSTFSTPAELEHLLRSSGCSILLLERAVLKKNFAEMVTALEPAIADAAPGALASPKFPFLRRIAAVGGGSDGIEDWETFLSHGDDTDQAIVDAAAASVSPADPGALFFSSGSTAKPKGILSAHRGVALQLWRWKRFYATGPDVRLLSANGFFWSGNFGMAIGGALSSGGSLILQATFNPAEALSLMETEKATMAVAWPHQWAQLEAASNWADVDLSPLKYVGTQTPLARHPTVHTDWQEPMAAYGNTETFTISAIFPSGTPEDVIGGSHGTPQPGMVFKIVDALTGMVVPMGERGEITVKGPTLMLGYSGIPLDETLDGEGFFRTGDGGYVDVTADGIPRLFWEGRLNDIIKTGGANVSPIEIDTVLKSCPGVKVTQTVGVPHETLGELVVTCIVRHEGVTLDEEGVRGFAKEQLASYKVPRRVMFFTDDALELTGTAKIKTADLKALVIKRLEAESE